MNFEKIYRDGVENLDSWDETVPERFIVKDENSEYFGQYASLQMLPENNEMSIVKTAICCYCCKDSRHYKDRKLLDMIEKYSRISISKLNDDGTNTMFQSNFRTGEQFGTEHLSRALLVFNKYLDKNDADEVRAHKAACELVERLAVGCLNGGFHTPNHRWVETAGLLTARRALIDSGFTTYTDKMLEKSNKYLAEGVDCDEVGEWSERSAGMYNEHCDRVFLNIYEMTGNEEYFDAVYRNLMLMRYYIDEDFAMFTQNSHRKDKGEVGSMPLFFKAKTYYAEIYLQDYIRAAYIKKDALLATVAREIFDRASFDRHRVLWEIESFLLCPEMITWEFDKVEGAIPSEFELYQPKSNIVRKKTNEAIYSLIAKNPSFMHIESRGIHIKMRLCSSFFAVAQFIPQKLEKTERGYKLEMIAHGEYKLPLDNPDGVTTKNYWTIDYKARKAIQQIDLDMSVETVFTDDGADFYVSVTGCDQVPTKLEFAINPGLLCEVGDAAMMTKSGGSIFSRGTTLRLESAGGSVCEIDGLFCTHLYAEDMRGSLDPIEGAFTVYATDFAPFEKKISMKFSKAKGPRVFK